ncbi:2-dehydro-3-deoxygalactonokinase [Dyella tabacisoli]|uniref:2-keto-3-deoxy-galactonokinase n=1 Tax=Dyella tabacisoli TaxID=2282381 RepID=A0A369UN12_9GAMM|nr:2-dehydro-3-deoxygalactonokinase [Dyella tabacisoli]RDD82162.1 2-keto-3-deoxy-galactonokinase [Dyella tabacisoli]
MSALIGLDWGTSNLRAMLMDGSGKVLESRSRPWGIRQLPDGGYAGALAAITAGWPDLPRLAAGMVGSRNGWREVPYLNLPATVGDVALALHRGIDGASLAIVPGLRNPRGPDVMRGEETQVIGLIATHQALTATVVLPGTHSKWVSVRDGNMVDFRTMMTGELYGLLRQYSILGAGIATDTTAFDQPAFVDGVRSARDSGAAGALSRLFATRARMLDGALAPASVPDYLSGLLIGEEFRAMRAAELLTTDAPIWLIGDEALCARYRLAASEFSIIAAPAIHDTAAAGLWHLANAAGLLGSPLLNAFSVSGVRP